MLTQFSRTELLLGKEAMDRLKNARVAVFGIGGVGGYVCEALVRTGVGYFDLIDDDKVCLTNLNRQIIATRKTVGKYKVDVMKERMLEINPDVNVRIHKCFFLPENADEFPFEEYDYVVDAVDTVTAKIELVMKCQEKGVPIMSSMGAGNKLDASAFRVAAKPFSSGTGCPASQQSTPGIVPFTWPYLVTTTPPSTRPSVSTAACAICHAALPAATSSTLPPLGAKAFNARRTASSGRTAFRLDAMMASASFRSVGFMKQTSL